MSTQFRIEIWSKWYPFDSLPTDDEWKAVHHLSPVSAVQAIKRKRIVDNGQKPGPIAHPDLGQIYNVRLPQSSLIHKQQIEAFAQLESIREENANSSRRRTNVAQSNNVARRDIRSARPNKKKRKR